MFVPSLSWQNDHLYIYRWLKKTVLGQCVMVVGNNHLVSDSTFTNNLFESSDAGVVPKKRPGFAPPYTRNDQFAKTGSGQT